MKEKKKLTRGLLWRQRAGISSIEFGRNLVDFMNTSYLMVFLTDVARVPAAYLSVMFVVCRLFDAFTDYLVSVFVDRTRTKLGRTRPWMLIGTALLAIGLIVLFHVPANAGTIGKVVYAYVTYNIFNFGMTMVVIPEGALIPALSADAHERTTLATCRGIFGGIANLIMSNLVVQVLNKYTGSEQAVGYARVAISVAIAACITIYFAILMIREINVPEEIPVQKKEKGGQLKSLAALFTDKSYIIILLYGFCQMLGMIPLMSELVYYFRDVVGNPMLISVGFSIFSIVPSIFSFFCPFINRKLPKKGLAILGASMDLIAMLILLLFRGNGMIAVFALGLWGAGNGFVGTMLWAMQPEIFDNLELKTGRPMAALPTAIVSYACKIGNAAAGAITAAFLAAGGYDGAAKVQSASAKNAILLGFCGVPIVAYALMIFVMTRYDLDKKYPEIRRQLDARHAADEALSAEADGSAD